MENNLLPKSATITRINHESYQTKVFVLKLNNSRERSNFRFKPGQFIQLSIPGFGEAPFSIASKSSNRERIEILAQKVGPLTKRLFQAKIGDQLGLRGPLGNSFPLEKLKGQNIISVSGGCGIAPIRSLMEYICEKPKEFGRISFFHGCRTPRELYFSHDYHQWKSFTKFHFIVEKPDSSWSGPTGVVTDLFKNQKFSGRDRAIICGPQIMIKFAIKELLKFGLKAENIYLSLERRMSCGVGVCQHCVIGSKYVCKDGPIFSLAEIREEEPEMFK